MKIFLGMISALLIIVGMSLLCVGSFTALSKSPLNTEDFLLVGITALILGAGFANLGNKK